MKEIGKQMLAVYKTDYEEHDYTQLLAADAVYQMERRVKDETVGTKSVSIIVGPGSGKSIIADLIALYELMHSIQNKKGLFCHATTRAHLLEQRRLEVRRRMPEILQHRFAMRLTCKLPEKAEAYCIDEFDEAFDQDLVSI